MAFYDPDWLGRRSTPDAPSLRTTVIDNGNLLQSAEGGELSRPSSSAVAALLAAKLPANQPYEMDEEGRAALKTALVQDLARPFKGRVGPELDLDLNRFKSDEKWLKLYKTAPEQANEIFQQSYGITFDDALKTEAARKKFLLDTIQKRVGSNELRQSHTGEWEEMGDLPDPTAPSGTRKGWTPASFQTQDMLRKIGGAEALGLMDVKRGLTALALRQGSGVGKETTQENPPPSETASPVVGEPLIGKVGRGLVNAPSDLTGLFQSGREGLNRNVTIGAATIARKLGNMGRQVFTGGQLQSLNPDMQDYTSEVELVNNLRARQGRPPITAEQYQAWLETRRASR